MPLTPEQQALKQAAQLATPGPWHAGSFDRSGVKPTVYAADTELRYVAQCADVLNVTPTPNEANARFIAAANPAAILALLAQLEAQPRACPTQTPYGEATCGACMEALESPPVPAQTGYAPKFDEAEFAAMVEKGTKAWAGVPDNWLEVLRGNEPDAQHAEILSLHRQLAAEKLRADQGWERYEAANRSRQATENQLATLSQPVQAVPDVLLDGMAVYEEITRKLGKEHCISAVAVSATLDAVARLIRAAKSMPGDPAQ